MFEKIVRLHLLCLVLVATSPITPQIIAADIPPSIYSKTYSSTIGYRYDYTKYGPSFFQGPYVFLSEITTTTWEKDDSNNQSVYTWELRPYVSGPSDQYSSYTTTSGSNTNAASAPSSTPPWYKLNRTGVTDYYNSITNYYEIDTTIELFTGGPTNSSDLAILQLSASATDVTDPNNTTAIAYSDITVLGKTPDTYGHFYIVRSDNSTENATPSLPTSNASFQLSVDAKYKLYITVNGVDMRTNVVNMYVGTQAHLYVTAGGPTISNINWSIPGVDDLTAIANFYANSTNGGPIGVLLSGLYLPDQYLYWTSDGTKSISCTAEFDGQTLTATATVIVARPTSSFRSETRSDVAMDDNYYDETGNRLSGTFLHFGVNQNTNNVGIAFIQSRDGSAGGDYEYLQLLSELDRMRIPALTNSWARIESTGLDTTYPYGTDDPAHDSPSIGPVNLEAEIEVTNNFTMYMMWKPTGANTIFVPIQKIDWMWGGHSLYTNGAWTLLSSNIPPNMSGTDVSIHPSWGVNCANTVPVIESP